jgi:putative membrane protein
MIKSLTEEDRGRIQEAVRLAEARTSGEIVPLVVPQSESYDIAIWKGGAIAAVLAVAFALLVFYFYDGWGFGWLHTGWGAATLALLAGTAGGVLGGLVPTIKRWLVGGEAMTRAVHRRAVKAFVEEEIFDTRDRTGILLFISLFEHRIEVLGDAGINQKVSVDEWAEVVETIRKGVRNGHLVNGLVEAIGMCGHLLEKSGVALRSDDVDELTNELRVRKGR